VIDNRADLRLQGYRIGDFRVVSLTGFSFISYENARKKGQLLHFPIENRRKRGGEKPHLGRDLHHDRHFFLFEPRRHTDQHFIPTPGKISVSNRPKNRATTLLIHGCFSGEGLVIKIHQFAPAVFERFVADFPEQVVPNRES
jgi:hypothetical protein